MTLKRFDFDADTIQGIPDRKRGVFQWSQFNCYVE